MAPGAASLKCWKNIWVSACSSRKDAASNSQMPECVCAMRVPRRSSACATCAQKSPKAAPMHRSSSAVRAVCWHAGLFHAWAERCIGAALGDFCAHVAQALERLGTRIAQTHSGICEFEAASFLDEQADTQMFFQHFKLAAHGAMGYVQLLSRLAHAVEAGRGFECAQG